VARSTIRTRKYDTARYLKTERDVVGYLEAAFEDGHPLVIAAALGDVARAQGMSDIARKTGLGRESLYKALAPDGNPQLSTVLSVLRALGLALRVVPERVRSGGLKRAGARKEHRSVACVPVLGAAL
jgi:probable addiction module antidote protein